MAKITLEFDRNTEPWETEAALRADSILNALEAFNALITEYSQSGNEDAVHADVWRRRLRSTAVEFHVEDLLG